MISTVITIRKAKAIMKEQGVLRVEANKSSILFLLKNNSCIRITPTKSQWSAPGFQYQHEVKLPQEIKKKLIKN